MEFKYGGQEDKQYNKLCWVRKKILIKFICKILPLFPNRLDNCTKWNPNKSKQEGAC